MAKAKLYLDKRNKKKDGTCPIKIALSHKDTTTYLSTGISVDEQWWNPVTCKVVGGTARTLVNARLSEQLRSMEAAIGNLTIAEKQTSGTAKELKNLLLSKLEGEPKDTGSPAGTFADAYGTFAERHKNARTKEIYAATWHMIEKWQGKERAAALRFEDIDKRWLDAFVSWLSATSPSVNARNIHLRNIRAVFNDAIDGELTSLYPFRRYKIHAEATRKRNLSVEELRALVFAENLKPWQQKYVDMFLLSFLLIGMNVGDMLSMEPNDYHAGRIIYVRKKTHKLYDVKVEPEAAALIEKYAGKGKLLNVTDRSQGYRNFAAKCNLCLKSLHKDCTTYWARHSWATIAASLDVPKDTIAAALGHGGNTVTDVYIDFDRRKVDAANRKVIDYVFYGKC